MCERKLTVEDLPEIDFSKESKPSKKELVKYAMRSKANYVYFEGSNSEGEASLVNEIIDNCNVKIELKK